jgi:hypothetical protein
MTTDSSRFLVSKSATYTCQCEIRLDNGITPDFGNIEQVAADVTRNRRTQKKLILLLYDTLPSKLEQENVEYTTEEFDKWLSDIKRSYNTEDVDKRFTRTVVDKWKMKVKQLNFGRKPIVF